MISYKLENTAVIWIELQPKIQQTIDAMRPTCKGLKANTSAPLGRKRVSPAAPDAAMLPTPHYPFPVVRHHATGRIVGDLGLRQSRIRREDGEDLAVRTKLEDGERAPDEEDDGKLVWELVCNLMPEYRGKGLMKQALSVAIEGWCKWIGIRYLIAVSAHSELSGDMTE
jgi:hypothetical protein